ncbi:MAG TPA: hypothetical protein VM681_06875 [Candidatus Thermoplasmatota archaeon]|nr:hypothetical protein [Candidatus Thermoplasmatota archaeon]
MASTQRAGRVGIRTFLLAAALVLPAATGFGSTGVAPAADELEIVGVVPWAGCGDRDEWFARWYERAWNEHGPGAAVPLKFEPTDEDLARYNLPPRDVLLAGDFSEPTMVDKDGIVERVPLSKLLDAFAQPESHGGPTPATFAGTGCLGIRPGAWLLLLTGGIGWCSMAHVYGSPGNYQVSTAGHCGNVGDTATVVAALGNRDGVLRPILLNFGKFSKSTGDGGLGKDWALISVDSEFQGLVSPTMCFWGGPRGTYTLTGAVATVTLGWRWNRFPYVTGASPSVTPNPLLAQGVAHYGHGTGIGAGGTPRVGAAIHWWSTYFAFYGAIAPGDSGSGANTWTGDAVGANMEAAGILTHIVLVDPPEIAKNTGALMIGTRATQVTATLANGQILPYPVPAPGLP